MKKMIKPIAILCMSVMLMLTAACDIFSGEEENLGASGTIETTEILLASEFGGLVGEVTVQEGEYASEGQLLVRFDDAFIQAQHAQALAALAQAEANLAQVETISEKDILVAERALDELFENLDITRAEAEMAVVGAKDSLALAENEELATAQLKIELAQLQRLLEDVVEDREVLDYKHCKQSTFDAAYAEYIMAKEGLEDEQKDYDAYYAWRAEDDLSRAVALSKLSEAKHVYERAFANMNYCEAKGDEWDISEKDAEVSLTEAQIVKTQLELESFSESENGISKTQARIDLAQAELDRAIRELGKLDNGPDPDELALAQSRLKMTKTGLAVAEAQVLSAEAALSGIEAQLDKLIVTAPMDGTVLVRLIEPGEVLAPGAPLITLARLDTLTISVYLPEDKYGLIKVGQAADVQVDSYPGQEFEAKVIRIADEAEYTPRNVQTEEDRRTTVFAIELSVKDPDGKLKPGMPADVHFTNEVLID
jgi:HlyD family secretion protein